MHVQLLPNKSDAAKPATTLQLHIQTLWHWVADPCRSLKGMNMKTMPTFSATLVLLALMAVGACSCASNDRAHSSAGIKCGRGILECRAPQSDGPIISAFSLSLAGPVSQSKQGDLFLYFDSDDCAGGALVGHHDEKGWLFPIGKYGWQELQQYQKPPAAGVSTEVITPITKAQEGFAFWMKTVSGRNAIVRIAQVQPATYDEVARDKTASVEFEWMWK